MGRHRTLEEVERMLDIMVENEGEPDVIQISGGEPTIHPQIFEILHHNDRYSLWLHVYGQDKWKNKFANDYGVSSTPSFYLLDAKKKILAKPEDVKSLADILN